MDRKLTQNEIAADIVERLTEDGWEEVDVALVKDVLAHLHDLAIDEIAQGLSFNLVNIANIGVRYVEAKPKRWVYSPATDEEVLADARPAKTVVKARPSSAARAAAPGPRTSAGKQLAKEYETAKRARIRRQRERERAAA